MPAGKTGQATLLDARGRVRLTQQLPATGPAQLDMAALPAGIYVLR